MNELRRLIVCGVLALAPALAEASPAGPPPALPDVGPPPALPDLGPPPSLPPTGGDAGAAPPSAPPTSAPPTSPGAPPGPPVMRPSAKPPEPASVLAPTSSPAPPSPVLPARSEPAPVPAPPPAAAPAPTPAPGGDPALQAPRIAGADPIAPEPAAEATPKADDEEDPKARRKDPKKWRHGGLILEPKFGLLACTRSFCNGETGHDARPGASLGGFIGGNVFGLLDVGIEAQWGTLRQGELAGRNAITLYGLDPALLQQVIAERTGTDLVQIDFTKLTITGDTATARAVNVGPAIRIHFIRKGRGIAYVGAGIQYQLWRNRYDTASGPTRLDFHGLSAPLRVGGGAMVHPNIAITGEFAYQPTFFVVTGVSHVELSGVAPLTLLEGAALEAGSDLRKGLPHFWSFSVNLRFRLGL